MVRTGNNGNLPVLLIVIIAISAVLVTPIAYAGGLINIPITKITFNETTSPTGLTVATNSNTSYPITTNSTMTTNVYSYYYMQRAADWFQTSNNTILNGNMGSVNLNFTFILSRPNSNDMFLHAQLTSVGLGNRTHTVYLSMDQGVRNSGTYHLTIIIDAHITTGQASYSIVSLESINVTWHIP
jgi:hypothetical protein